MPELPDVEEQRRRFVEHAEGRRVRRVRVPAPDVVRNTSPQGLGRALKGRRFADPRRHGKWLLAPIETGGTLVLHFGMTGELVAGGEQAHPHDRVIMALDEGELRLRMQRKLGGVWFIGAGGDLADATGELGPDALELDRGALVEVLSGARGMVKPALTDQSRLAGLGNLLADEICWRARIHPRARVPELDAEALTELAEQIGAVLDAAVPTGRVPPHEDWLTGARDEDDPHCPRCGAGLDHAAVGQRSTWWCPSCQP